MRLGQRVIVGFLFIALIVGILGGFVIRSQYKVEDEADIISTVNIRELSYASDIAYNIQRIKSNMREVFLDSTAPVKNSKEIADLLSEIKGYSVIIKKDISDWQQLIAKRDPQDKTFKLLVTDIGNYLTMIEYISSQFNKSELNTIYKYFSDTIKPLSLKIQGSLDSSIKKILESTVENTGHIREEIYRNLLLSIFAIFTAFFSAVVLGIGISRSISAPMERLRRAAEQISSGDLDIRLDIVTNDETAQLASSFNSMVNSIKDGRGEIIRSWRYVEDIVNSMKDGLIIVSRDGIIKRTNLAALQMMGYRDNELTGLNLQNLIQSGGLSADLLLERLVVDGVLKNLAGLFMRKDGAAIHVLLSASFLSGPDKDEKEIVITFQDVSDIRATERKLRYIAERFEIIFESSNDGIAIMDTKNRMFVLYNRKFCDMLGCSGVEIDRFTLEDIFPQTDYRYIQSEFSLMDIDKMEFFTDVRLKRKDGSYIYTDISASVFRFDEDIFIVSIFRDVTDKRNAYEMLKTSLREKEVLLREIHHRVKNNLQIISSLLGSQLKFRGEKEITEIVRESQNRIYSMASIHESLYSSSDLISIDFEAYVKDIGRNLLVSYTTPESGISIRTEIKRCYFNINEAIPAGLIVNELICNSLKHAFPDGRTGEIWVRLDCDSDRYTIIVSDNGIGIPEDMDISNVPSYGFHLVHVLTTEQLNGDVEIDRSTVKIVFNHIATKL